MVGGIRQQRDPKIYRLRDLQMRQGEETRTAQQICFAQGNTYYSPPGWCSETHPRCPGAQTAQRRQGTAETKKLHRHQQPIRTKLYTNPHLFCIGVKGVGRVHLLHQRRQPHAVLSRKMRDVWADETVGFICYVKRKDPAAALRRLFGLPAAGTWSSEKPRTRIRKKTRHFFIFGSRTSAHFRVFPGSRRL